VKDKIGRPCKYKSPEQLLDAVAKYFDETPQNELTVTGLALVVGSKQLLQDYQKRKGYSDVIIRAKLLIEENYEKKLLGNTATGAIFALKNMGWSDKQEVEHGISTKSGNKFSITFRNESGPDRATTV